MPRIAASVDANQAEIVAALRKAGCVVHLLHAVGKGTPDLLCGYKGKTYLIEVKNPDVPRMDQQLTPAEITWHETWRGGDLAIIKTVEEALAFVGALMDY